MNFTYVELTYLVGVVKDPKLLKRFQRALDTKKRYFAKVRSWQGKMEFYAICPSCGMQLEYGPKECECGWVETGLDYDPVTKQNVDRTTGKHLNYTTGKWV